MRLFMFSLSQGCRQGCPNSPALFSTATVPVAVAISSDKCITGIKTVTEEHKLALYADDVLIFISQPSVSFQQSSARNILQCQAIKLITLRARHSRSM